DGKELLVSQIYFDDALSDIIYGEHPDYLGRPARDTRNDEDCIIPEDAADHMFDCENPAAPSQAERPIVMVADSKPPS
ncbi:hypothetical protein ACCS86_37900, partial [Rhizobium ruizarguesonis]